MSDVPTSMDYWARMCACAPPHVVAIERTAAVWDEEESEDEYAAPATEGGGTQSHAPPCGAGRRYGAGLCVAVLALVTLATAV